MKKLIFLSLIFFSLLSCREEIITPQDVQHEAIQSVEWKIHHPSNFSSKQQIVGLASNNEFLVAAHDYAFEGTESALTVITKNDALIEIETDFSFNSNSYSEAPYFTDIFFYENEFYCVGGLEYDAFNDGRYRVKYNPETNLMYGEGQYSNSTFDYLHNIFAINDHLHAIRVEDENNIGVTTLESGNGNTVQMGTLPNSSRIRVFQENFYNLDLNGKLMYKYGGSSWKFANTSNTDIIVDVVEYNGKVLLLGKFDDSDHLIYELDPLSTNISPYFSEESSFVYNYDIWENTPKRNLGNSMMTAPQFQVLNDRLFVYGSFRHSLYSTGSTSGLIMQLDQEELKVLYYGDNVRDMEYFNGRYYAAVNNGIGLLSCTLP